MEKNHKQTKTTKPDHTFHLKVTG
ncbi:hypothetical protein SBV1_340007 [Verrucomicrobia bacterium]|nr:hypothetical protein SBV1_340007 [Verrucomicrobiota bacterium]